MELITKSLILLLLTFSTVYAKNGYDYYYYGNGGATYKKLNKTSISRIAKEEVKRLSIQKKIPNSWRFVPISKIKKSNSDDWMISFNNPKIKRKSKQKLYIFINIYGHVLGVNYTGH